MDEEELKRRLTQYSMSVTAILNKTVQEVIVKCWNRGSAKKISNRPKFGHKIPYDFEPGHKVAYNVDLERMVIEDTTIAILVNNGVLEINRINYSINFYKNWIPKQFKDTEE